MKIRNIQIIKNIYNIVQLERICVCVTNIKSKMKYISDKDAEQILSGQYGKLINLLERVLEIRSVGNFHQPIKPYLRFPEESNRIIAMPAYVGDNVNTCGIKWIASFPKNFEKYGIRRANSVTILNHTHTGEPYCIINSTLQSIYRTAAVSGIMIKKYLELVQKNKINIGIVGYGPIGKAHEDMIYEEFVQYLNCIYITDIKGIDTEVKDKTVVCESEEDFYENVDIFITCTTAPNPYIYLKAKHGSLILNVSLRDFIIKDFEKSDYTVVVDDWEEVAREKTNIETMYKDQLIEKKDTIEIFEFINMVEIDKRKTIFFNPMGLAIFDVSVASFMYVEAEKRQIGVELV